MSTPIDEYANPFGDPAVTMSDSGKQTSGSIGVVKSAEGTTPEGKQGPAKGKKRVGFTGGGSSGEGGPFEDTASPKYGSPEASGSTTPSHNHTRNNSADNLLESDADRSHLPELSQQQTDQIRGSLVESLNVPVRPRPAIPRSGILRPESQVDIIEEVPDNDGQQSLRQIRAQEAFQRGKRLEHDQRIHSEPNSRQVSPRGHGRIPSIRTGDIPLEDLNDEYEKGSDDGNDELSRVERQRRDAHQEAYKLVRRHTDARGGFRNKGYQMEPGSGLRSGAVTPTEEREFMEDYQPRPQQYRGGVLGTLLKLYGEHPRGRNHSRTNSGDHSALSTPQSSPPESGATTPTGSRHHWYSPKNRNQSNSSLAHLIGSSASIGSPAVSGLGEQVSQRLREQQEQQAKRPGTGKRNHSGNVLFNRFGKLRAEEEYRITNHIAETISRQKYLMKLCRALMQYGAPTHRLEEYLRMSARILETDAQFLYIPGAMIMSFEDRETHTSEVKLVKVAQGLDLGKLRDVHEIYKEVVHDKLGVEDATKRLKEVANRKDKFNRMIRIPVFGLAAVCVGPFAFGARLIDLPIAFVLGCILGILQLYVAPQSDLYANVFEISAAVITSFLARAFGSINNGNLFCFSALAQSSIALILPGYTVLCASLELQSRSIVAGSVRMVYAIIYSLFLGFGITVGTAIYGLIDSNATSDTECKNPTPAHWFFFFVPGFTMCLIIINQAKWKQAPMMMIIAFAGYVVNFFSSQRFAGNTQISNTLGALAIGVMANLYSRIGGRVENKCLDIWEITLRPHWKTFRRRVFGIESQRKSAKALEDGHLSSDSESIFVPAARRVGYSLAAAAMLPAIFVQVPSGLSVNGSLVSGITSANQITGNTTNGTTVLNTTTILSATEGLNSIAFSVGYSVIQVAIGITVGLFLSAIVVYPFGKRRSGLFSF